MRGIVATSLRRAGFVVIETSNAEELIEELGNEMLHDGTAPDLIVTDIRMPGRDGVEVLAGLRRAHWSTPVILMTAFADLDTYEQARRLNATVFDKPFDLDALRIAVVNLVGATAHA